MTCSIDEFMQYIDEEDIKFIRLLFCDIFGTPKNISVMPCDIKRAFESGIGINPRGIPGFGIETGSDIFLHPEADTAALLPWRPDQGRVVRLFCDINYEDKTPFAADSRNLLREAVKKAESKGVTFTFGTRIEFYLFKTDEEGEPTMTPFDKAGYMDIAPLDKGENVRREICLTLERMGITPFNSHHEAGPGQNEIDFVSADPIKAADDTLTYISVVKTIAARNGLYADFSPKPLSGLPGNGFHVNVSASKNGESVIKSATEGILQKIYDLTIFMNRCEASYQRIGKGDAPRFITWSSGNYGQLVRASRNGGHPYAQLRSPDAFSNPYLIFALLIEAGLYGIENDLKLRDAVDIDLREPSSMKSGEYTLLPRTIDEAKEAAKKSEFIKEVLPESIISAYCD